MIVTRIYVTSPHLMVHHTAILIPYCMALYMNTLVPYCLFPLLAEVNTVFLFMRWLYKNTYDVHLRKNTYLVIWILQWGTFFVFRYLLHGGVIYLLWLDVNDFQSKILWGLAVFFSCLIMVLNTQLLRDLVKTFLREAPWKTSQPAPSKAS